jgi:hypothetical protein
MAMAATPMAMDLKRDWVDIERLRERWVMVVQLCGRYVRGVCDRGERLGCPSMSHN